MATLAAAVTESTTDGFYPGTGDVTERGPAGTPGTTINVPLPPFAGDVAYLAAIERVVEPAVRAFVPDAMVVHLGADVHHADPYTHLQVTIEGLEECYRRIVRLADGVCDGRLLDTAGGGYNPTSLGRIWALQLTALMGVHIGDELPDEWRRCERRTGAGRAGLRAFLVPLTPLLVPLTPLLVPFFLILL